MNQSQQVTSDYRGSQNNTPTVSNYISQPTSTENMNNRSTYSNATKSIPKINFPKKDQAIVLNAVDSLKLADYIHSLAEIIGPKNILFASRIANNRICVYLANKEIVEKLLETRSSITIGDAEVGMRKLITPAKRLILSNVCPTIPHEIIENSLKNVGFKLVSPITFLRAGIAGDEFSHILSFRRQVYIAPVSEEVLQSQTTIVVLFEDTQYRIFLSCDDMTCFICKQKGHVANNCPNPPESNLPTQTLSSAEVPENTPQQSPKRPLQSASSSTTSIDPVPEMSHCDNNVTLLDDASKKGPSTHISRRESLPKSKRPRNSSLSPNPLPGSSLDVLKSIYEDSPMPMPFPQFKSFLENSFGISDPLSEARRFTTDIAVLLETMRHVYPHLQERSLKSRFTRLSKKIKSQLRSEGINTENMVSISPHHSQISNTSQEDMDTALIDLATETEQKQD